MQLEAITETFQHVFTTQTVLVIFAIVAGVALIGAGILFVHIKRCDPIKGSLNSFLLPYCAVVLALLAVVFFVGITI